MTRFSLAVRVALISIVVFSAPATGQQSPAAMFNRRGNDTARAGDWVAAVMLYSRAIGLDAGFAEPYYNRGKAQLNLERYAEAIDDLTMSLELNPANADAYNNRGIARKKSGDLTGAVRDYDAALQRDSVLVRVYMNRGLARYILKDKLGACQDFQRAAAARVAGAAEAFAQVGCQ